MPPIDLSCLLRARASDFAARTHRARAVTRRGAAAASVVAACLLIPAHAALAGGAPGGAEGEPGHGADAVESVGDEQGRATLSDWLTTVDRAIRSLTATTDRVASRALAGRFDPLARRHDERLSQSTNGLLAGAPAAAQTRFWLLSRTTRVDRTLQVAARMRAPASVDAPPPAKPRTR